MYIFSLFKDWRFSFKLSFQTLLLIWHTYYFLINIKTWETLKKYVMLKSRIEVFLFLKLIGDMFFGTMVPLFPPLPLCSLKMCNLSHLHPKAGQKWRKANEQATWKILSPHSWNNHKISLKIFVSTIPKTWTNCPSNSDKKSDMQKQTGKNYKIKNIASLNLHFVLPVPDGLTDGRTDRRT